MNNTKTVIGRVNFSYLLFVLTLVNSVCCRGMCNILGKYGKFLQRKTCSQEVGRRDGVQDGNFGEWCLPRWNANSEGERGGGVIDCQHVTDVFVFVAEEQNITMFVCGDIFRVWRQYLWGFLETTTFCYISSGSCGSRGLFWVKLLVSIQNSLHRCLPLAVIKEKKIIN